MSLVVIGTGTDVGKTVTSAVLLWRYRRLAYWKPVATGPEEESDLARIRDWAPPDATILPEHYRFEAPLSPHHAAAREQTRIDPSALIRALARHRRAHTSLLVEGIGGLLVPLTEGGTLLADLLVSFALPVLLVARSEVGTINHTLLTLEAMRARSLAPIGVVMNGPIHPDNRDAIERFGGTPVVAEIPPLGRVGRASLERAAHDFDRVGALARYARSDK